MWGRNLVDGFFQDIRYGLRQLGRSQGLSVVITVSLALGIGANTAIFSVINAVMLRLLPVHDPERLVQIAYEDHHNNQASVAETFTYPMFKELRERNQVFTDMAVAGQWSFTGSWPAPPRWTGQLVSANFFSVLGVNAVLGRVFATNEDKASDPVVVISYALWTSEFGRDPAAIGHKITLGDMPFTIIGVAPAHFSGIDPGQPYDLWALITMLPQLNGGCECGLLTQNRWWNVVGRLRPHISLEHARANVDLLVHLMQQKEDATGPRAQRKDFFSQRIVVLPVARGRHYLRKEFSHRLFLLMGMAALVLVVACANVASLLLARTGVRQREIAVRLALGAGRRRLVRQLLTESVLLALMGGVGGVLFAYWGSPVLVTLLARSRNQLRLDVHPDLSVLGFTLLVALATGIAFGLAPALRATRTSDGSSLQTSSRTLAFSGARRSLGQALVVAQVALTLVLVIGAGLLARTLRNLEIFNAGFDRQGVLLFGVDPTLVGYKGERLAQFYDQLQERITEMPGVRSMSFSAVEPFGGHQDVTISVQGYTPQPNEDMSTHLNSVGPRFFETLGIPFLVGREFGPQDRPGSPRVAIINQAMARRFFAGRDPIGGKFGWIRGKETEEFEIVGVVGDAKYSSLREQMLPTAYLYILQGEFLGALNVEVRATSNPTGLMSPVRNLLRTFDSRLAPWDPTTLAELVDASLYQEKLVSTLSTFFGVLALLLACVGLYGIMSYTVMRRTNEIGIRMALGAERNDILRMVLRDALLVAAIGIAIGLPSAWSATRFIASMLYGLKPTDPETTSVATVLLLAVAVLAGYLPARRASRLDPMVTLRHE